MAAPTVVYRALNTYSSWCERGPKGAVYSASKSGWFDGYQYEKWFFEIFLPNVKKKEGKKLWCATTCRATSLLLSLSHAGRSGPYLFWKMGGGCPV
jgi:hypothetical protein